VAHFSLLADFDFEFRIAIIINFFIKYSLLAQMSESGPIKIKTSFTRPHAVNTLGISEVSTNEEFFIW
jgi:hypothetical protein